MRQRAGIACTKIVLLSTHIISDIEAAASRIMVLKKGNLMFNDIPQKLLHNAEGFVWEYILPDSRTGEEITGVSSMAQTEQGIKVRQVSREKPCPDAVLTKANLEDASLCVLEEVFL